MIEFLLFPKVIKWSLTWTQFKWLCGDQQNTNVKRAQIQSVKFNLMIYAWRLEVKCDPALTNCKNQHRSFWWLGFLVLERLYYKGCHWLGGGGGGSEGRDQGYHKHPAKIIYGIAHYTQASYAVTRIIYECPRIISH